MSTLKSSAENLILNADGSGNDIKFQSNGVEKASLSDAGLLTVAGDILCDDNTNTNYIAGGIGGAGKITFRDPSTGHAVFENPFGFKWTTSGTERLRILAGGGITFNGDSAAANALDDYEEGTWTPTCAIGTPSLESGVYTRVGRLVHCNGTLTCPTQTNGTPTILGGLPFTSTSYAYGYSGYIRYTNFTAGQLMITQNSASTTWGFYDLSYGSSVTQTNWTEISGNRIDFSIIYNAA